MEKIFLSYDESLFECIKLFKQYDLSSDIELKEKAFNSLKQTKQMINKKKYVLKSTKWGVCLEYLAQKFIIDLDTDNILYELDVHINNQLNTKMLMGNSICDILWIGDYFLLRTIQKKSQLHFLSMRSIYSLIVFYTQLFDVPKNQKVFIEPVFFFPSSVCIDLEIWLKVLLKNNIYTKEVIALLDKICNLKKDELFLTNTYMPNIIRQETYSLLM